MILPYEVRTNIVWSDMQTAWTLMDSVASGRKPMQLIGSASGFGKTTKAKERFRRYGIVSEKELYRSLLPLPEMSATSFPGLPPAMLKSRPQTRETAMRRAVMGMPPFEGAKKRLFIETRPTEEISLVRTLYQCAMLQAAALLFDDPGRIADDGPSCDILKTSFGLQRTVTFETPEITRNENRRISGRGGYDPFLPPPDFPVPADLRWLWLANVNYTDPSVLAKLGDHFAALIARGLNPFWIRDDAEHDHHDLFLCVHHLATEENLLRSMGFTYDVSRKAVNFYVTHANSLVDLCPRRLELIAQAFAVDQPPAALEAALTSMAPTVIRPKLQLPASWVTVPDGVLLWPEKPFAKVKPTVEGAPPRRIRRREREYKRLHEPNRPEPRTPAATPDPDPDASPAASAPMPEEPEPDPDPPPAASAPIPVKPDPDPDASPAASAPISVEPEPDPGPPPVGSTATSIASERHPTPDSPGEPFSRAAILQDVARILRGRITQAMITGTAERLHINGYDENKVLLVGAEWPSRPDIQDEFLLQLIGPAEAKELRELLAGNGAELPKGHIPIREIKTTKEKFKVVHDIEWTFTCGPEVKADLIAGARHAKVTRPWRGSFVQLHVVDGQLSFERSPFEYDLGDLEWALKKKWTRLSLAPVSVIQLIVPGLLGDYVVYLRGYAAQPWAEIERQRQMSDVGEDVDRENLSQIDDAFDNYWGDDMPSEPPVPPDPEPASAIQEPPIEDASPDGVERNCVRERDAILDMVLPPGDSRQGAFLGAVKQMKVMGENVDEPVLAFIRRMAIRPDRAAKLFEPDSVGAIIDQAKAMMAWFGPIDSVRETDPVPTIHQIANALSDEETAEITRRYDLRAFHGRMGELDVVAYRRRAALLKIAGPKLTRDELVIVRKKPKGFWQEQGAAEDLLAEMLNLLARGDVP